MGNQSASVYCVGHLARDGQRQGSQVEEHNQTELRGLGYLCLERRGASRHVPVDLLFAFDWLHHACPAGAADVMHGILSRPAQHDGCRCWQAWHNMGGAVLYPALSCLGY